MYPNVVPSPGGCLRNQMWHVSNCLEYYNGQIHTSEVLLLLRVTSNSPFLVEDVVAAQISSSDVRVPSISFRVNRGYQHLEEARRKVLQYSIGTTFVGRVYLDSQYRKDRGAEKNQLWLCFLASDVEKVSAWIPLVNDYCVRRGVNWTPPIPSLPAVSKVGLQSGQQMDPPQKSHLTDQQTNQHRYQPTGVQADRQISPRIDSPRELAGDPQLHPHIEYGQRAPPEIAPQNVDSPSNSELSSMILAIESLKLLISEQEKKFTSKTQELEAEITDLRLENKRLQSKLKGLVFLIERRTASVKKMVDDIRS